MVVALKRSVLVALQLHLTSAPCAVQKVPMMQPVRTVAILMVVLQLAACAAIQKSVGGWFGEAPATPSPTPQATPTVAAQAPRVYYAGVEGLRVYSDPSASAKVVGKLSLHERVTRTKLERGFAFVESATSGAKGWVNNAQLIWRLPTAPTTGTPAAAEPQPEEPEPEAPTDQAPQEPPIPEPTATASEPAPASTPVPAAPPTAKATPRGVAPSIFDAY
jgi:hypothetical protein